MPSPVKLSPVIIDERQARRRARLKGEIALGYELVLNSSLTANGTCSGILPSVTYIQRYIGIETEVGSYQGLSRAVLTHAAHDLQV